MSGQKKSFANYCGFKLDEKKERVLEIRVSPELKEFDDWIAKQNATKSEEATQGIPESGTLEDANSKEESSEPPSPAKQLEQLITRFYESMVAYQALNFFSGSLMPAFESKFVYESAFKLAEAEFESIKKEEGIEVFGLTQDQLPELDAPLSRAKEIREVTNVLPNAILLSLVATFDSAVAETIRILLRARPERFHNSEDKISLKELFSMDSFDDAIDHVIEKEIDSQMRGSHEDQVEYIKTRLGLEIRKHYDEWPQFIEIFERRNLVAHGDLIANSIYMKNCEANGYDLTDVNLGDRLVVSRRYLSESARHLMEFGVLLIFGLWRKYFTDSTLNAYEKLNALTFEMIDDQEYKVAARILESVTQNSPTGIEDKLLKMMTVNLANAHKKDGNSDRCDEILESVDWSATSDDFKISIASIRSDVDEVLRLMPSVAGGDLVPKEAFRTWPVFDWVRDDESIGKKFEELFSEPLIKPTQKIESESASEDSEDFDDDGDSDDPPTVH